MVWVIVVIGLLAVFCAIMIYYFSVAFVKHDMGDMDDINAECNKVLGEYRTEIGKGIEYLKSKSHKWVYTISFDGLNLAARYFDNNSDKTIILFHGYRSTAARDFSCAIKMYTDLGFNILLCDQRSHGKSEGRLITFGIKESRDVCTWVEFAINKLNCEKIALGGMSMGATTVVMALSHELPENVKAVIADCGFTAPVDIIKKVARDAFKINASFFIPFLDFCCRIFGRFSIKNVSTVDALKNSDIPVLFIHGEDDCFVPCEMSRTAYSASNSNCHLLTVKKADHGMSFLMDKKSVLSEIKIFLTECGLMDK